MVPEKSGSDRVSVISLREEVIEQLVSIDTQVFDDTENVSDMNYAIW